MKLQIASAWEHHWQRGREVQQEADGTARQFSNMSWRVICEGVAGAMSEVGDTAMEASGAVALG